MSNVLVGVSFFGPDDRLYQEVTIIPGQAMTIDIPPFATVLKIVAGSAPEPPVVSSDPSSFRDRVLEWLRDELNKPVVSVEKVTGSGTDWLGDTESGFYSEEYIEIDWTDTQGRKLTTEVRGDSFLSLWGRLVGAILETENKDLRDGGAT